MLPPACHVSIVHRMARLRAEKVAAPPVGGEEAAREEDAARAALVQVGVELPPRRGAVEVHLRRRRLRALVAVAQPPVVTCQAPRPSGVNGGSRPPRLV